MTESMAIANSAQNQIEILNSNNVETEGKPIKRKSKNKIDEDEMSLSYELQQGFRIVKEMMSDSYHTINQLFMNKIEESKSLDLNDYYRVIKNPMWLTKIKENFSSYNNITQVVGDLRLMLENCYRYHGPDYPMSKKGIKLEMILEQKLMLLSRDLRDKTSLEMTSGRDCRELKGVLKLGGGGMSLILHQVKNEKAMRTREVRKRQILDKKVEKQGKDKVAIEWEKNLVKEPVKTQIKTSWELPQIGHFLYLCQQILNTPEVPQYELERVLLMPQEAGLLARIMTSLLSSPNQRIHLDKKRPMTYQVWTEKLKNKVQGFYKCYLSKNRNVEAVFGQIGVEPLFFEIVGENNPLEEKSFHELTFPQRIWVLKSICDYSLHNHQTVKDGIADQPFVDQRDYLLGLDEEGNRYLHFPQFCGQDLRIYRQGKWRAPKIEIPAAVVRSEKQRRIKRKLRVKS
uniref:Bromo domain-containing protein n=1 Tax=Strigamia maritima TaxID=126957 RepID=T1JLD2_STRMM